MRFGNQLSNASEETVCLPPELDVRRASYVRLAAGIVMVLVTMSVLLSWRHDYSLVRTVGIACIFLVSGTTAFTLASPLVLSRHNGHLFARPSLTMRWWPGLVLYRWPATSVMYRMEHLRDGAVPYLIHVRYGWRQFTMSLTAGDALCTLAFLAECGAIRVRSQEASVYATSLSRHRWP